MPAIERRVELLEKTLEVDRARRGRTERLLLELQGEFRTETKAIRAQLDTVLSQQRQLLELLAPSEPTEIVAAMNDALKTEP